MNEDKKKLTGTRLPFIETSKKNEDIPYWITLFLQNVGKCSHTIIIFIWRVPYETVVTVAAAAAFNDLTDENSVHRANKITHHNWKKKWKIIMCVLEKEGAKIVCWHYGSTIKNIMNQLIERTMRTAYTSLIILKLSIDACKFYALLGYNY